MNITVATYLLEQVKRIWGTGMGGLVRMDDCNSDNVRCQGKPPMCHSAVGEYIMSYALGARQPGMLTERELSIFLLDLFGCRGLVYVEDLIWAVPIVTCHRREKRDGVVA